MFLFKACNLNYNCSLKSNQITFVLHWKNNYNHNFGEQLRIEYKIFKYIICNLFASCTLTALQFTMNNVLVYLYVSTYFAYHVPNINQNLTISSKYSTLYYVPVFEYIGSYFICTFICTYLCPELLHCTPQTLTHTSSTLTLIANKNKSLVACVSSHTTNDNDSMVVLKIIIDANAELSKQSGIYDSYVLRRNIHEKGSYNRNR